MKLEFDSVIFNNTTQDEANDKVAQIVSKVQVFYTQLGASAVDPEIARTFVYVSFVGESPIFSGQIALEKVSFVLKRWVQDLVIDAVNGTCDVDKKDEQDDRLPYKVLRFVVNDDEGVGALIIKCYEGCCDEVYDKLMFTPADEDDDASLCLTITRGRNWFKNR